MQELDCANYTCIEALLDYKAQSCEIRISHSMLEHSHPAYYLLYGVIDKQQLLKDNMSDNV